MTNPDDQEIDDTSLHAIEGELLVDEDVDRMDVLADVARRDDPGYDAFPSQAYGFAVPPTESLTASDAQETFMAQLRHIPPLSAEQQDVLAKRYYHQQDAEAAKTLIMSNMRLVVKIAREYQRRHTSLMELIQEGNVGLAEAIKRYDPYKNVKFTSYAQYWVRAMIRHYVMNVLQTVKVGNTRAGRRLFYLLPKARARLMHEGNFNPAPIDLVENIKKHDRYDAKESEIIEVSRVLDHSALSLDAPAPGFESTTLGSVLSDPESDQPDELVETMDIRARIRHALDAFRANLTDKREKAIWDRRVSADPDDAVSLQELGDDFGVSRERIRQVEKGLRERFKTFWIATVGEEDAALILEDR